MLYLGEKEKRRAHSCVLTAETCQRDRLAKRSQESHRMLPKFAKAMDWSARHLACTVKQHHTETLAEKRGFGITVFAAYPYIVHVQDAAACR